VPWIRHEATQRRHYRWEPWPHTVGQSRFIPKIDFPPEGRHTPPALASPTEYPSLTAPTSTAGGKSKKQATKSVAKPPSPGHGRGV
jgi:hypothetical protein